MVSPQDKLERFLFRLNANKEILGSNKKRISEFIESRQAKGNAPNTLIKYLYPLYQMNSLGWVKKSYNKLTKEEVQELVIKVEKKDWSPKTKKNFRLALKVFYRWLEGEENFAPNEYPTKVKFISTGIPKRDRKEISFNDIITREEVIKMAQHTANPMHKALLWCAFESGARPQEILDLKKSDVEFDSYGTRIFLQGSKSKRHVRLVSSTEPLRDWLRKHPLANKPDFGVWVTQFSKKKEKGEIWTKLSDAGANKMLKELGQRCGIKNKRITMYSLRKGRATELAADPNVSRSVLHAYMGWEEGSSISRNYVKLSGETTDQSILASNGIKFSKKEIESFIECQFCGAKNSPSALYCERMECGKPLVIGDMQKELRGLIKQLRGDRKVLVKQILNDPEFERELLQRLEERKAEQGIIENVTRPYLKER